jgi:hypothetical protein
MNLGFCQTEYEWTSKKFFFSHEFLYSRSISSSFSSFSSFSLLFSFKLNCCEKQCDRLIIERQLVYDSSQLVYDSLPKSLFRD